MQSTDTYPTPQHTATDWSAVDQKSITTIHQQLSFKLTKVAETLQAMSEEKKLDYNPLVVLIELLENLGPSVKPEVIQRWIIHLTFYSQRRRRKRRATRRSEGPEWNSFVLNVV